MSRSNSERAELARRTAHEIGDMLYEKQMAYGDSGGVVLALWQARLAQYQVRMRTGQDFDIDVLIHDVASVMNGFPNESSFYILPASLIAHIPRITRVDDRTNRIISNPGADRLGEDPWLDMAGDAIIGAIMPRVVADRKLESEPTFDSEDVPCHEPECEIRGPHDVHGRVSAAGVERWSSLIGRTFENRLKDRVPEVGEISSWVAVGDSLVRPSHVAEGVDDAVATRQGEV